MIKEFFRVHPDKNESHQELYHGQGIEAVQ